MGHKILIAAGMDCAYRWNEFYKQLEWNPILIDGILDEDEWGCIEEEFVGDEVVTFEGIQMTESEAYREIERRLGVENESIED